MSNIDFPTPVNELTAPAKALNELALNKVDLLVDLQVQAVRRYASMILDNWMTALTVSDLEDLRVFMEKQALIARETMDALINDAAVLAELGQEYTQEVQGLISDNVSRVSRLN